MKFLLMGMMLVMASYASAQQFVAPSPNIKPYSATVASFVPAAAPTDICTIRGSSTKRIKITGVEVSTSQTTSGQVEIYLVKRVSPSSGGTSALMSTVGWNSGFSAPTAVVSSYVVNPTTLGASAGPLYIKRVLSPVSTAVINPFFIFMDATATTWKPITLNGINETLAVNFNGATAPAGFTINCTFEFIEE